MCTKLVLGWPKHTSSTDTLKRLCWLPIQVRIEYKILSITYNCIRGQAPQYLKDLITINKQKCDNMRSNNKGSILAIPKVKHETFITHSFKYSAPLLWNHLPQNIKETPSIDILNTKWKLICIAWHSNKNKAT